MRNIKILEENKNQVKEGFVENKTGENVLVDDEFVKKYIQLSRNIDSLKKEQGEMNSKIKEYLIEKGLKDFETSEGKVKLVVTNKTSFDEDRLLEFLKDNKIDAVKTIEVIDEDKLEKLIYDGDLDASLLEPYQKTTTINTLRVSK